MPMCTPHSATPISSTGQPLAAASTRSATTSTSSPAASNRRWLMLSDSLPNG